MTRPRSRTRRRRQSGYTLIEIMMAVGIMVVGSVGVMALQQATTRGNSFARQTTTATEITQVWLERLRRDALLWNQRGQPSAPSAGGPIYLSTVPAVTTTAGAWYTPVPAATAESYAFNWLGNDTRVAANISYCTHIRLRWVVAQEAIRADVRTWWHRQGNDVRMADGRLFGECAIGAENGVTTDLALASPHLHAVYGSTLLRWTQLRQ